jgi:hypothetical protein
MHALKLIIDPSETETRLLARDAETSAICLRATLPTRALHPLALPSLLVGLASFLPIHAALVVPARAHSCATKLYPSWFSDVGGRGYELQIIGETRRERAAWWRR